MNPILLTAILIVVFYFVIQIYRVFCTMFPKIMPGASYIANTCPRCFSIVFVWMIGIFILPKELVALLIGVSAYEFADIAGTHMNKKHSKEKIVGIFLLSFLVISWLMFGVFEVLTLEMFIATLFGAFILDVSLSLHNICKQKNKILANKVPTALLTMFLLVIMSSFIFEFLGWF